MGKHLPKAEAGQKHRLFIQGNSSTSTRHESDRQDVFVAGLDQALLGTHFAENFQSGCKKDLVLKRFNSHRHVSCGEYIGSFWWSCELV